MSQTTLERFHRIEENWRLYDQYEEYCGFNWAADNQKDYERRVNDRIERRAVSEMYIEYVGKEEAKEALGELFVEPMDWTWL